MKRKKNKAEWGNLEGQKERQHGLVARIWNRQALVLLEGKEIVCMLPGGDNGLETAVGDRVIVKQVSAQQYRLIEILPRSTELYRGNRRQGNRREGKQQQGGRDEIRIAVNADCLVAVVSADYLLHQAGYLEMAAAAARRAGMEAGFFISKWDLVKESAQGLLYEKLDIYRKTGDFVYVGSAREPQEELIHAVKGKSVVVAGDRGCGKTTLIRGIMQASDGIEGMEGPAGGTTAVHLYEGTDGTLLTDTPGFREWALSHMTEEELGAVFPEITELAEECRFADCSHTHEDGCRVLEALREKRIRRERFDVYQRMKEETDGIPAKMRRTRTEYRHNPCMESFVCQVCGNPAVPDGAGSMHRNHCPKCLCSVHVDNEPGDRASLCKGIMDPVSVWVRKNGEWAIIHRCRLCGTLSSNRIAADDNPAMLMSVAVKPLAMPPFPLDRLEEGLKGK